MKIVGRISVLCRHLTVEGLCGGETVRSQFPTVWIVLGSWVRLDEDNRVAYPEVSETGLLWLSLYNQGAV